MLSRKCLSRLTTPASKTAPPHQLGLTPTPLQLLRPQTHATAQLRPYVRFDPLRSGFFGTLNQFTTDSMYGVQLANSQSFLYRGVAETIPKTITLNGLGWTYLPCPYQEQKALAVGMPTGVSFSLEDQVPLHPLYTYSHTHSHVYLAVHLHLHLHFKTHLH